MASTRRLLERVPEEKGEWKPHEKSFPLGHLAQLVAGMPGWFPLILDRSELDLSGLGRLRSALPIYSAIQRLASSSSES